MIAGFIGGVEIVPIAVGAAIGLGASGLLVGTWKWLTGKRDEITNAVQNSQSNKDGD